MELKEIIKSDEERLFIVDLECFLIFTGDSIQDSKPFIRIGTWTELPVEVIPLIENIIITDDIIGNPSHEQFNIDIDNLANNSYIGSESTLVRFLDYQRNFGLDLTNVSSVNVEKDIPELPIQQNISNRDQFIGIFYGDGNVKIVHNGDTVFDLNLTEEKYLNITGIHEKLSKNNQESDRYKNPGFIILNKNPMFYNSGFFTSYQFPQTYLEDFSLLNIDPEKIREILLPSHNIINISGLMKQKYKHNGKIKIFSDNSDQINLIKKLFNRANIKQGSFSKLNYNSDNGINIRSDKSSPNLRLNFRKNKAEKQGISIAFIKSSSNIKKIISEKHDMIIITYTTYENSVLLFKSSKTPVFIMDDGNPNIQKMKNFDKPVLYRGMQYELKKYSSTEEVILTHFKDHKLISMIDNYKISEIEEHLLNLKHSKKVEELFNSIALINIFLNSTHDRKLYSSLSGILQNYSLHTKNNLLPQNRSRKKIIIALYNKQATQIITDVEQHTTEVFTDMGKILDEDFPYPLNINMKNLNHRIIHDRKRLDSLIKYFYKEKKIKGNFQEIEVKIQKLKKEINNRKDIYNQELFPDFTKNKNSKQKNIGDIKNKSTHQKKLDYTPKNIFFKRLQDIANKNKIVVTSSITFFMLILSVVAYDLYNSNVAKIENIISKDDINKLKAQNNALTVTELSNLEKEFLKKNNVKIREIDIYHYANDVAVKNGYAPISYSGLKKKNPNWIYPSSIFVMLDLEKIMVRKGDTLWDLSRKKLEKINFEFYTIVEKIKSGNVKNYELFMQKASELAYLESQKKILKELKSAKNED